MIHITMLGNAGKDSAQIMDGVYTFSLASTKKTKDKNGIEKSSTIWVDVLHRSKFEFSVKKGQRVVVIGELFSREHNGKTYMNCNASRVYPMGASPEAGVKNETPEDIGF